MEILIGLIFKRNKYGLSDIEQVVTATSITWRIDHIKKHVKPIFMVKGDNHWYEIDEVVFFND